MAQKAPKSSVRASSIPEVKKPGTLTSHQKSKRLADELNRLKIEYGDDMVQLAVGAPDGLHGGPASIGNKPVIAGQDQFPVRLFAHDPYDEVAAAKMTAPEALGNKTLTDQDLRYLKRKQDIFQEANLKSFVSQLYDARDPGQAALLDKIFPQLNNEREAIIEQRAELEKRLAKIRLRGPQDESDLKLLFAISSGAIEPPKGELWNPESWFVGGASERDRLQRGLFNPRRLFAGSKNHNFMPFDRLGGVLPSNGPTFMTYNSSAAQPGAIYGGVQQPFQPPFSGAPFAGRGTDYRSFPNTR